MKYCKFLLTALSLAMVSHSANADKVLPDSATSATAYVTFVPEGTFTHTLTTVDDIYTAGVELGSDTVIATGSVSSPFFTSPLISSVALEWASGDAVDTNYKPARIISGISNDENKILVEIRGVENTTNVLNEIEDFVSDVNGGMFGLIGLNSELTTLGYEVVLPGTPTINPDSYRLDLVAYAVVP